MPKKTGSICCVVGCKNSNLKPPGTTFHCFSVKKHKAEQREKWIKAVKRINPDGTPWQPSKHSQICSRHFIGNKKSDHPLSPSFIPTIFPKEYLSKTQSESSLNNATERFKRSLKRKVSIGMTKNKCFKTVAASHEELMDNMDIKIETITLRDGTSFCDQGTQVYLPFEQGQNVFICNRLVNDNTSEAETQACLSISPAEAQQRKIYKRFADKICGSEITCKDQKTDTNPLDLNSLIKCPYGFHGFSSISNDDDMLDLAGVNMKTFQNLLKLVVHRSQEKLSRENCLLLFLIRMKLGISSASLGVLFNLHGTMAARIFESVLTNLSLACKNLITWPTKETIQATMPEIFKKSYGNCRVIMNCLEFKVEQTSETTQTDFFKPDYKNRYTINVLVGYTPNGVISFVSPTFGGDTTVAQITDQSNFLHFLEPNDMVLADERFSEIKKSMDGLNKGISLVTISSLWDHFVPDKSNGTRKMVEVGIYIDNILQRIKSYHILTKFNLKMLPLTDDIIFMCCVLKNLKPPI